MPRLARVLPFPTRPERATLSPDETRQAAQVYLSTCNTQRLDSMVDRVLSNPDVLAGVCALLREMFETAPASAAEEATTLHTRIRNLGRPLGLFDERDYFLGETALIAATALRFMGKFVDAERWLDRAEAGFRHTINPAPLLANLAYARLALRYAVGRYDDVLELVPSLVTSFGKLGMQREQAKCCFLEAKTLIQLGRLQESLPKLTSLRDSRVVRGDRILLSHVLIQAGNCFGSVGDFEQAASIYEQALPLIQEQGPSVVLAELKWSIGDTYKAQNQLAKALDAYRAAQRDYASLTMETSVALLHLVAAEALLSLGRHREAEWEILAALPTIEEQKMVAEGFAAVALLKESVRRRKADPNALRELREYLQARK
jgi:tetratricopeptide (TPR) repeat protein